MEGYKGSGQSNSLNLLTSGVGPKHPKFETKREAAALESHSASLKPTFIAILGFTCPKQVNIEILGGYVE